MNIPDNSNSEITELETDDSPRNTAFSVICLLNVRVSTPRLPNPFGPCLSDDLSVYPKIQTAILGGLINRDLWN